MQSCITMCGQIIVYMTGVRVEIDTLGFLVQLRTSDYALYSAKTVEYKRNPKDNILCLTSFQIKAPKQWSLTYFEEVLLVYDHLCEFTQSIKATRILLPHNTKDR